MEGYTRAISAACVSKVKERRLAKSESKLERKSSAATGSINKRSVYWFAFIGLHGRIQAATRCRCTAKRKRHKDSPRTYCGITAGTLSHVNSSYSNSLRYAHPDSDPSHRDTNNHSHAESNSNLNFNLYPTDTRTAPNDYGYSFFFASNAQAHLHHSAYRSNKYTGDYYPDGASSRYSATSTY
jgi:hypothetical protein